MVTQVPSGELTVTEQSLVEQVGRGEWLDLVAKGEAVDEAAMRSWTDSRSCRATVIRDILRGRLGADPDPHGLRLRGARITGRLDLENLTADVNLELKDCLLQEGILAQGAHLASVALTGSWLENPAESALDADGLTCSMLDLTGATFVGHVGAGTVRLVGAHIGNLVCDGASLRNDSGPALAADGLQVGRGMLARRLTATGAGDYGTVRLLGAHIGGSLECDGANLHNASGAALDANNLQADQDVFLRGGFTATGSGDGGAVSLIGAHIGGNLECDGANLRNDSGPALAANGLQVGRGLLLRGLTAIAATGGGQGGAVQLVGAHIGGSLECDGANLRNASGAALIADNLRVGLAMYLRSGFTATSAGVGAVRLDGAHVGGQFSCEGARLRNDSGPALYAHGLQVGQDIFLFGGFTATGAGAYAAVDLGGARVGGRFYFDPERLEHSAGPHRRLNVDGLTYGGVPELISPQDWLDLLRDGTPGYAAQPYQQLAAGYRALGGERQARDILIAQRDAELNRTDTRWTERLWGKITRVTLGYGYEPWRALLFLAAVVAISCVLAVTLGLHGALAQTSNMATPGRPCTVIQQLSVGLDLNLPVGTSLARSGCDLTTDSYSVTAAWLTGAGWVLRLLAWVFAALFIAGFTSAVRKT